MEILPGVVLLAAAGLVYAFGYGLVRGPQRARWTQNEALAVAFALTATCLFSVGIGLLGAGIASFPAQYATLGPWPLAGGLVGLALLPSAIKVVRGFASTLGRSRTAMPIPILHGGAH